MKTYGGITCIDTIGDRFTIQSQLPDAVVPKLDWEANQEFIYRLPSPLLYWEP